VLDRPALEVARSALLAGEAEGELVFAVAHHDASWLAESVATIVRANRDTMDFVLAALTDLLPPHRDRALVVLRQLDKKADSSVRRWAKQHGVRLD
jgi:RNase P/RNase MRP subunit POP5